MEYLNELLALIAALNDRDVAYVLVGGAAINVHGFVRATEDVDLFVAPTADNVSRLKTALQDVWSDPDIEDITAEDLCGDFPIVRYGPPSGHLYVDIIARIGDLAAYADIEAEVVHVRGVPIRVATPRSLYWLKKNTVRPIDAADAQLLARAFDLEED